MVKLLAIFGTACVAVLCWRYLSRVAWQMRVSAALDLRNDQALAWALLRRQARKGVGRQLSRSEDQFIATMCVSLREPECDRIKSGTLSLRDVQQRAEEIVQERLPYYFV